MKLTTPIFILFSLLSPAFIVLQTHAQRLHFEWDSKPVIHTVCKPEYLKESAIVLQESVQMEYTYDKKHNPIFTRRVHKIIRVNDEKGIELYNKLKINYSPDFPVITLKGRTITPSGKVIELKPEAFKDLREEDGSKNRICAFEGVEKGAEIEYIAELSQPVSLFGNYLLQDIVPTCNSQYEILSPANLIYELKGYNQVTIDKDSVFDQVNSFYAHAENLPGLEEEKMATYLPHFARLEFSLAYNTEVKGKDIRILTWDDAAKNSYKSFTSFESKELKSVGKLLENNPGYKQCTTMAKQVAWIEDFVKTNYVQQEYVPDPKAETMEFILKNKLTNESGIKLFFSALFQSQHIPFEIGFTTDRFAKPFDYSFQNWDNLKQMIFYFPDLKQYMAPGEFEYRMPFIPARWCGNSSMFCKVLALGDVVTAKAEKRQIPECKAEDSYHNHDVDVYFNTDMDTAFVHIKNSFIGYNAIELMPVFVYLDQEKRDDAAKQILQLNDKEEKVDEITVENNRFMSIPEKKPLVIGATIHAGSLMEKAGNKYLFKVGDLIGRQSEMYQEKERQFDIEIPNAHQYTRKLKIHVPAGYAISNLDKLNMNIVASHDGKENCKFVSSYALNGDLLEINVFEIYHNSFTPKAEYEAYRKVINAAADFNKIVLVLEKK